MQRLRLPPNIQIARDSAIFSFHQFIIISKSPDFNIQLLSCGVEGGEPLTLKHPLLAEATATTQHSTSCAQESEIYLSIDNKSKRISYRRCFHDLFHAFRGFAEYERITTGSEHARASPRGAACDRQVEPRHRHMDEDFDGDHAYT